MMQGAERCSKANARSLSSCILQPLCRTQDVALCLSDSKENPQGFELFDTVDSVVKFFRSSPKRTHLLGRNLPKPGDTRWLSRDTAIGAINSLYEEIGTVLHEMAHDANEKADTQATARGLCLKIQHAEFVFFLKLYRVIFDYCAPMMKVMQKPTLAAV